MAEAPGTLEGWYALHDLRRIDWARLRGMPEAERDAAAAGAAQYLETAQSSPAGNAGASAAYAIVGHKADILFLHLRPRIEELADLERSFNSLPLAAYASQVYSYLSVTELSLYEAYARGGTQDPDELRNQPFVRLRLHPSIPDADEMPYISFYPMNKRRGETVNWYASEMEERRRMMREHGATGRRYHGRVQQMITGSTGLDDWEWGITLFAKDPLDVKKLVYEMRFDEVSAKYADFGPFYFGARTDAAALRDILAGRERSAGIG